MNAEFSPQTAYHEVIESLGPEALKDKLRQMHLVRAFEEKVDELFLMGRTYGTLHLCIGQEATNVGSLGALAKGDYFLSHHRGHGHFLTWSDDPNRVMADILGTATGFCRGKGGTMHIADIANGNLGGNGIVGGGLPVAVGVGLSIRLRRSQQVCMVIFGDGAANEGAFHESLNMASIWKLPLVYLCENNQYAMSTPLSQAFNIRHISERAAAYGIPGVTVDGNDFFAVYLAVREAVERARRGDGPTLVESVTYRIKGHSRSDRQAYRTREEVRSWQEPDRDPILRLSRTLQAAGIISEAEADSLRQQAVERVEQAVAFADSSPDPDPATMLEDVSA
jgi:acetoin:2,6-dichlorophenolindophenol oxidoreductase subunit alpha